MRLSTNSIAGLPPANVPVATRSTGDALPSAGGAVSGLPDAPTEISEAANAPEPTSPAFADLTRAVAALQEKLQSAAPSLQFTIDKDTGQTIVKVIDTTNHEVIRQIPPEEIIRLAKTLAHMQEVLLHDQA